MRLSIIIVNTNESHVLRPCLRSVFEQTNGIEWEAIVVDNCSTDGSREMVSQEFPKVKIIANSKNLGFAAANNQGIRYASGAYVLLLNPDTEIIDAAIRKTVSFMDEHPHAGIVGCKLIYPNGKVQRSVRSFPSVWNVFFETSFMYLLFPKSKIIGRYYMTYFDHNITAEVDWVMGAYFMIRREVVDTIGLLDEQFFMYTEEVDYCYRAKHENFQIWFFSGAEIIHHWGGPTTTNPLLIFWNHKSQILFFKKHFCGIARFVLIFLKYLGLIDRIVVYSIAGVLLFDRKLLRKAYHWGFALCRLLLQG